MSAKYAAYFVVFVFCYFVLKIIGGFGYMFFFEKTLPDNIEYEAWLVLTAILSIIYICFYGAHEATNKKNHKLAAIRLMFWPKSVYDALKGEFVSNEKEE